MIYAAKIKKTDGALTVGGYSGKLLNDVFAFANKADFDAEQDRLWQGDRYEGWNLIRISRKQVEAFFTRHFAIANDGKIFMDEEEAYHYNEMYRAYDAETE